MALKLFLFMNKHLKLKLER